jgi:hypothetical protein
MIEDSQDMGKVKKFVEGLFSEGNKNMPSSPGNIELDEQLSVKSALDEIEIVREAFIEFQAKISGLVITGYLQNQIELFADHAIGLREIIENQINEEALNVVSQIKYTKIKEVRMNILKNIMKRYGG